MSDETNKQTDYEFVVVGSGAGGGTVAARLAESGRKVLLLEAGGDPRRLSGGDPHAPNDNRLPDDYDVPVFHGFSTENDAMKWDFFVRHYADDGLQGRDAKYRATWQGDAVDGVLYPRAGTLGGCTAHNALIMVYPDNADWDDIAALTGDPSWNARSMRKYFARVENCRHRLFPYRWLSKLGIDPTWHGWDGWLHTEKSIPKTALEDRDLEELLFNSAFEAFEEVGHKIKNWGWLLEGQLDPNDWRLVSQNAAGICYTPLTTRGHQRIGTRERLLETARKYPDRLTIEMDALATKILFAEQNKAIGVEYLKGEKLYKPHVSSRTKSGERRLAFISNEVILSGGAFNTPQLLMLSGIGPRDQLTRHNITTRIDLPGVGKNLQDRYEVGVVNRMREEWPVLKGARFAKGDQIYSQWENRREGVYTSNGAVLGVIKRSLPQRPVPDLFCFALVGLFKGYFPEYSKLFADNLNYLTWAILKGHTNNRAGEVTLRSDNPQESPQVNFRYFDEGSDRKGEDLDSVVEGIKFVRRMTANLKRDGLIAKEELPGDLVQSDDDLRDFVRYNAWGHHASCTCAIGQRGDKAAVLDNDLRVHGTSGLRVVDASVFPRIPGLFIVSAVYMIGEKAAEVILKAHS